MARAGDMRIAFLEQGDGPLALCLHGFPDSPYTWRHLLPELAAAGHRAVAPFGRGYAPTSLAPEGSYQLGALIADVEALHEELGGGPDAVLIGHDWGASIAYGAFAHSPHRWRAAVGLAVPPGDALSSGFLEYDQLKQKFYIFLCQVPLAELAFAAGDFALIDGLWRDWAPGLDFRDDVARVKACVRAPEHLTAVIGYYRSSFNPRSNHPAYAEQEAAASRPPVRPMLYLHGRLDNAVPAAAANQARSFLAPDSKVVIVADAGHFLHLEQPGQVNKQILDWIGTADYAPGCVA